MSFVCNCESNKVTALCFGVLLRVRAEFRVRLGLRVWVGFRVRALQRNKRHESGYALLKDVFFG